MTPVRCKVTRAIRRAPTTMAMTTAGLRLGPGGGESLPGGTGSRAGSGRGWVTVWCPVSGDVAAGDGPGAQPGGGQGVAGQQQEAGREADELGWGLVLNRARDRPGRRAGGELARGGDVADDDGLDQQAPDAQAGDGDDLVADGGADADADGREQSRGERAAA